MNKVLLIGRLSAKPFAGKTNSNIEYSRFTLVVPRQFQLSNDNPDYIPCIAWRNNAEFINKYLDKGSLVHIEGTFQSNRITNSEGNLINNYSVSVDRIETLESRATAENRRRNSKEFNIPSEEETQKYSSNSNNTESETSASELIWDED
ncbi:single-stranded DNA-binding protein [Metamycoplasma hyosynoviae]|uniref:single-stranded DNA-binding protein n=1 Tax=Metamycoplasma hyosynoviae TaxID=29559 RepID=UPI002358882F|nr:single-stranded DNA-binding protein [Metamycoplasma hyosynoviae]MDC8921070.1 single-stranded DNA-binding protein [Metamycoplasma hyosynoviae]